MLWKNGLKTRPLRLSPGGRREICLQVRVWPRGLVLHGVSWQSAAGAENWHGAADQRGGHGAAVALWRKHGIRTGGTLLPAAPLQRGLRLLTSAPQNPHLHPTLLPPASIRTHETVVSSNSQPLGELDWTHTCSGASLPLCLKQNTYTSFCSCLSDRTARWRVHFMDRNGTMLACRGLAMWLAFYSFMFVH